MLNSTQQFHEQVAIQHSQQRRKNQQLRDNNLEVRKTELLIERYQQEELLAEGRREQRRQDEMAGIMLRRLQG
ncbi:flagellar FliJ family protein [Parendozoicomonas sp. Alg238-R29]|uniref:flagellar FliJ family protein n=1 Tax=Parendozoicomonas sp. Alg238-R29 TaxID=2993446 RepID=UPI00248D7FED|nr:flagellar FliJ family protein [Parendozoicomonas sp. Alg238-R29]